MDEKLEMKKETLTISGDRNLYNYTFVMDGQEQQPMTAADVVAEPASTEQGAG